MTRTRLPARALLAAAVSLSLMHVLPQAQAQSATAGLSASTQGFDIPAQSLAETLTGIARSSGRVISLDPKLVEGLRAPAIRGDLTAEAALRAALAGTSLELVVLDGGTLTVRPQAAPATPTVGSAAPTTAWDEQEAEPKHLETVRATRLSTVNVEGTRSKTQYDINSDISRSVNDAQAYYVFDASVLRQSAAVNVEDFLRTRLTMNDSAISFGQQNMAAEGVASTLNLRGMGSNKTLILINGRRMAGSNQHGMLQNQTNLNSIPMSAIERIEVLPSSASGIYGGGAMGGVINVILKKDFSEREVSISYENPEDTDASIVRGSFAVGETFEDGKTRLMVNGQRTHSNSMRGIDRQNVINRYRDRIMANNPDFLHATSLPYGGSTPNIGNLMGTNLVLKDGRSLGSPFTHISPGALPSMSSSQLADMLIANAGSYNLEDELTPHRLLSNLEKDAKEESLGISLRRTFSDRVEAYADFYYDSSRSADPVDVSATLYLSPALAANPFTDMIAVRVPRHIPDIRYDVFIKNRNLVTGVSMEMPRNWTMATEFIYSESVWNYTRYQADTNYLISLMNAGLYNPFSDVMAYPQGMNQPNTVIRASTPTNNKTRNREIAVRANGDLFDLPWGTTAQAAVGLNYWQQRRGGNSYDEGVWANGVTNSADYYPRNSTNLSLYAETTLPLVPTGRYPLLHALDLQLALRTERRTQDTGTQYAYYEDGRLLRYVPAGPDGLPFHSSTRYSATTPTVAIKYQPVKEIILRASYAEAFLPPSSTELALNPIPAANLTAIIDPLNGQRYQVQTLSGGNPDLTPLQSEAFNAGIVYMPSSGFLEGWRLGLEYYNITQNGVIASLSAQQLVDSSDQFPDRVIRDPNTGLITQVNTRLSNLAQFKTRGFDVIADTIVPTTNLGTFGLNIMGTLIKSDSRQVAWNGPYAEVAGYYGGTLRVRGNLSFSWDIGNWLVNWNARYYHSYNVGYSESSPFAYLNPPRVQAQGANRVASQTYHDLIAHYYFPQSSGLLEGVTIQFGIKNLFDKLPPMDVMAANNSSAWLSPYGDMRMRSYVVNLTKRF